MDNILDICATAPKAEELLKAFASGERIKMGNPKSAIIDPYMTTGSNGLRQKPTAVPYSTLRRMAKIPAVAAIINTRLNQVARFSRRPRFEGDMGFKIVLKDREAKMNEAQKKRAFELEEFFMTTGAVPNAKRKDNFDKFMRKIVRDTLTLDVVTFENVGNRKGTIAEVWAIDGATIELVASNLVGEEREMPVYEPMTRAGQSIAKDISYVQRVNGQIIAEFTEDELCFAIRNPQTDINMVDFGMSELETLIEIITGIMNSVRYNTSYFSESHLPQGILEIVGSYEDSHLEGFKKHWKAMTSGASGKWAVPVMALKEGQGFKFTNFKNNNRDMEFNEFLEFLFNIACAVYQIDPNEVGFKSWTSGGSGTMKSDNTEVKIDQSKDKGFVPLMQFLANTFNSEIVDRIDDQYAFTWIGIDEQDEEQKWARYKEQIDSGVVVVAEIRKKEDMDELLDEEGKPAQWTTAPGNPTLIQVFMAEVNAKMAEDQQAQQQQQGAIDGAQEKMTADDAHGKALEVMDKQHQQGLEAKKLDQEHQLAMADKAHKQGLEGKQLDQKHQTNIEQMKAKAQAQAKKPPLKKSLDTSEMLSPEEEELQVSIEWGDY